MKRITILSLLAMFIGAVKAGAPTVSYSEIKFGELTMPNMTAEYAVITMAFQKEIKLKGIAASSLSLKCRPWETTGTSGNPCALANRTITRNTADNTVSQMVPDLLAASHAVYMKCRPLSGPDFTVPAMTQAQLLTAGTAPSGILMLHPTAEPAASIISMFGGLTFPHLEWYTDRISVAVFLNGTRNGSPFSNTNNLDKWQLNRPGGCWLVMGKPTGDTTNTVDIIDSTSAAPLSPGSYFFNQTERRCTEEGVERLRQARVFHESFALNITTKEHFMQWHLASHYFSAFEAWGGCTSWADSLYTASELAREYNNTIGCVAKEGSSGYLADPCCNDDLAKSQPCIPRYTNRTLHPINIVEMPSNIKGDSDRENKLILTLHDYANVKHYAEFDELHEVADDHSTNLKFPETEAEFNAIHEEGLNCVNEVKYNLQRKNVDCHVNQDCPFSLSCDQNIAGGKKCKTPRTEDFKKFFVACMLHSTNDEVVRAFHILMSMDTRPSNSLQNALDSIGQSIPRYSVITLPETGLRSSPLHFIPDLVNLTQTDCVGPHSARCRSNFTILTDAIGNIKITEIPANRSCCEITGKQCNWNARGVTTQTACETDPAVDHFCGIRDGSDKDYTEIGHPGKCIATKYNNSGDCGTAGFTWYTELNGFAACARTETTIDTCLGTSNSIPTCTAHKTNIAAAISGGYYRSDDATMIDHPLCGSTVCYTTGLTATQCRNLRTQSTPQWTGQSDMLKIKAGIEAFTITGVRTETGTLIGDVVYCVADIRHKQPVTAQTVKVCQDMTYNLTLTSTPMLLHNGRAWRVPQWDGIDDCLSKGRCNSPGLEQFGTTSSTCDASSVCAHPCSRCVSPLLGRTGQKEKGLCYDTEALSEGNCRSPCVWRNYTTIASVVGGTQEHHAVCECAAESSTACTAIQTGTGRDTGDFAFVSCGDQTTQATCYAAGPLTRTYSSATAWMYKALSCAWDVHQPCRTHDECAATEGRCDDDELDLCNCIPGLLCNCQGGACINVGQKCLLGNANYRQTRLGCMDLSVTTNATCQTKGGVWGWEPKAYTQTDCLSHGSACKALSSFDQHPGDDITNRNNADCFTGGSGNITTHYRWLLGSDDGDNDRIITTVSAKANVPRLLQTLKNDIAAKTKYQTTEWVPRTWVPSGTHTDTLGSSALHQFAAKIATMVAVPKAQRRITQHSGRIIPLLAQLAAANTTDAKNSVILTHHPVVWSTPMARANYMKEQTALLYLHHCTPDPLCEAGKIDGTELDKLCMTCNLGGHVDFDATEGPANTIAPVYKDIPPCTCRKDPVTTPVVCNKDTGHCTGGLILPPSCDCVNDDGVVVTTGHVQQPLGTNLLQFHKPLTISTITAGVASAFPFTAATGGNECPTQQQQNDACGGVQTIFKVASCALIQAELKNCFTALTGTLVSSHTVFGSTILANFAGAVRSVVPANILAAITFTDVPITSKTLAGRYAVIRNHGPDSRIVGQLMGDCIVVAGDDFSQFPLILSAPLNPLVQVDKGRFPLEGFCAGDYAFGPPLMDFPTTSSNNGTYISTQIYNTGTYCPCAYEALWFKDPTHKITKTEERIILGVVFGVLTAIVATYFIVVNACGKPGNPYLPLNKK